MTKYKLHSKLAKGILIPLAFTSSLAAFTIDESSIKASVISSTIDTNNISTDRELKNQGLGLEVKLKTKEFTPSIYLGVNRFSDRNSLNLRVGLEESYKKIGNLTPFVSASIGGVVSQWTENPISSFDTKDSTSSGMIVNVEGGAYFPDELFASASISLTNLKTEINNRGSLGSLNENAIFAFSFGKKF